MISHVFMLSKESHFSIGNAQMEDQNSEIWLSDVGCPVEDDIAYDLARVMWFTSPLTIRT